MARRRLPEEVKRVQLWARVTPQTYAWLKSLGEPNQGRAIDKVFEERFSGETITPPAKPSRLPPPNLIR